MAVLAREKELLAKAEEKADKRASEVSQKSNRLQAKLMTLQQSETAQEVRGRVGGVEGWDGGDRCQEVGVFGWQTLRVREKKQLEESLHRLQVLIPILEP